MLETVADISKGTSITFNYAADKDAAEVPFKYGWCNTDHKNGKELRPDFRTTDFLKKKPYADFVKKSLEKLGLPFPETGEVFRGTHHDLLFLDSHGVVIRIGPLDVKDLMNPAIIQPLGWFESKHKVRVDVDKTDRVPFTIAIYPGIELYKHFQYGGETPEIERTDVDGFLAATGQGTRDVSVNNMGIIRVFDEEKNQEVAVEMLLDPDNEFNGSSCDLSKRRSKALHSTVTQEENLAEAVSRTLTNIFSAAEDIKWYQKAFEVHEPLRRLFWEAFKGKAQDEMPDTECMKLFWDTCARVTNNPASCTMPVWKAVEKDGEMKLVREEAYMPHVVLYRPWTGHQADKFIPPIGQSHETVEALRKAHLTAFLRKNQENAEQRWLEHLEAELEHGEYNWQILADRLEDARRYKKEGEEGWKKFLEEELHLGEDNWEALVPPKVETPVDGLKKILERDAFLERYKNPGLDPRRFNLHHRMMYFDLFPGFGMPDLGLAKKIFGQGKKNPAEEPGIDKAPGPDNPALKPNVRRIF